MKKVIIVGGGAAGIFLALLLSEKEKDVSVEIIEKSTKIGRKLRATGNGHANLLNKNITLDSYNGSSSIIKQILANFEPAELIEQYKKWGVPLTEIGDLYYPLCHHAPSFVNHLTSILIEKKVKITTEASVLDYRHAKDGIEVILSNGKVYCDDLIFATGLKSAPKLGSGDDVLSLLAGKGYAFSDLYPGLTPIKTQERISKSLDGIRHKAAVTLVEAEKIFYKEHGEILYKKDGLSGICIMNISSKIKWLGLKKPVIHVDLFPGQDISLFIDENHENEAVLEHPLYLEVLSQGKKQGIHFNEAIHNLIYTYKDNYGFENSQVTIGGLIDSCINDDLSSKIENHVHFAGEILNVDGLCGGFNLAWALISAMIVSRSI